MRRLCAIAAAILLLGCAAAGATVISSAGQATATSNVVGPVVASAPSGCTTDVTSATFASAVSSAKAGNVLCLASGSYGTWSGTNKAITITSQPGANVTLGFDPTSSASSFTIDGTLGGGTISSPGGDIANSSNLTIQNIAFTGSVTVDSGDNMNIVFNRDSWDGNASTFNDDSSCNPPGRLHLAYDDGGNSGVTVENSDFVDPSGGISNAQDGIQTGEGMTIKDNVFQNIRDNGGACHNDAVQAVGATGVTVTGNLFVDDADGFVDFDDSTDDSVTDNACVGLQTSYQQACVVLYGDLDSVVNHNTSGDGVALLLSYKTGGSYRGSSTGTTIENNVGTLEASDPNDKPALVTHNLYAGAKSPDISGTPTFAGGKTPSTWAGFELAAGSAGKGAATDGTDVGIRATTGGPPSQ